MTGSQKSNAKIRPIIAGNWKMNGLLSAMGALAAIRDGANAPSSPRTLVICPPFTLLKTACDSCAGSNLVLGAQDCHTHGFGAFTGDVSAPMLADCGARFCIVGHSERRALHQERDVDVHAKALAALGAGLTPIICLGEREDARDAGKAHDVVMQQLERSVPDAAELKTPVGADGPPMVIAYEPVWAIGTGHVPTNADIIAMHEAIRGALKQRFGAWGERIPILYGGSVKPSNAREILALADVNGALVGGASLNASDFLAIAASLPE